MKNFRTLEVKTLSATNTKGYRIKITDLYNGENITIDWDYKYFGAQQNAEAFFKEKNIEIVGWSETKNTYIYFTSDFLTKIK